MSAETTPAPGAPLLRGRWFDGRTSAARAVLVGLVPGARGPALRLHPLDAPGTVQAFDTAQVGWPEAWSAARAPRTVAVDLRAHGSLEIDDAAGWRAALAAAGERPPLAQRMQTRWAVFLAVAVLAVGALAAFYRWGTPWAATALAAHVPLAWETGLSEQALQELDRSILKPSKLPAERQAALRARFDALVARLDPSLVRYGGYTPRLTLSFRAGMGANAFALPGGTIVMTDGMVEAAARHGLPDEALVGVMAHEIGHVVHRHTTRMVVEQGVLNIGLGMALGDVSTLLSTGASALTGLAYRRGHEREADCFALALMRRAGLPTAPMGELLGRVSGDAPGGKPAPQERGSGIAELLSTHPDTPQRAQALRSGSAPGCPS